MTLLTVTQWVQNYLRSSTSTGRASKRRLAHSPDLCVGRRRGPWGSGSRSKRSKGILRRHGRHRTAFMSVAKTGDSVVFISSMIGADGGSSAWLVACWRVSSPAALIGQAKRREWPPTFWANHDGLSVAFSSLGIWWGWQSDFALRKAHESGRFAGWQCDAAHQQPCVLESTHGWIFTQPVLRAWRGFS
jgi:hypothetical protein